MNLLDHLVELGVGGSLQLHERVRDTCLEALAGLPRRHRAAPALRVSGQPALTSARCDAGSVRLAAIVD
jgi:hypothetical protein